MPVEIGLARAAQRGALDRFEQEQTGFFQRVRDAYLQRAADQPERFAVIDASPELDQVQSQIAEVMTNFMQRYSG